MARSLSLSHSPSPPLLLPHYRCAFFACAVVASLAPCWLLELAPPRRAALALLPLVPHMRTRPPSGKFRRASTRARAHGRSTTNDATCGPPAWLADWTWGLVTARGEDTERTLTA